MCLQIWRSRDNFREESEWSTWIYTLSLNVCLTLLLVGLAVFGKRELNRLEEIDKGASSYQYLKAFDDWLKSTISDYTRISRVFYPVLFLIFFTGFWFSSAGESVLNEIVKIKPDVYLIKGIPMFMILGAIAFACCLGFVAGKIYKWDMDIVYGREFKKLNEIIADMEELRR